MTSNLQLILFSKITKTLPDEGKITDIATLTKTCIGNSKAKPTAALYMRIAFLVSLCHQQTQYLADWEGSVLS